MSHCEISASAGLPRHRLDTLVPNWLDCERPGDSSRRSARFLARMHHGKVNAHVAQVLATLIVLLVLSAALSR